MESIKYKFLISFIFCILLFISSAIAQNTENKEIKQKNLKRGFTNITLGLEQKEIKTKLKINPYFLYGNGPELSLPSDEKYIIQLEGNHFIDSGVLQFTDDKLSSITIFIDTNTNDYYSFYTKLAKEYGEPKLLNPQVAQWEDNKTLILLEKPLTYKIIDKLENKKSSSQEKDLKTQLDENLKEQFLKEF